MDEEVFEKYDWLTFLKAALLALIGEFMLPLGSGSLASELP